MKVLVSWIRELGRYVSREFHFVLRDLLEVHGWSQVEPWVLMQDHASVCGKLRELFGSVPDTILFWECHDLAFAIGPQLRAEGCRLVFFIDDLHVPDGHAIGRERRLAAMGQCHLILTPYAYAFAEYYPEMEGRVPVHWVPHAASPDFELPMNPCPSDKILLSGFVGMPYPLRTRLRELARDGLPGVEHLLHPGYREDFDYACDTRVGPGYASTIHQHRAAFTDAAIYGYVVAKHFEIPATGALLVADQRVEKPLARLGFIHGEHYVGATLESLEDVVREVLDPDRVDQIDRIRGAGQELVHARHLTRHRAMLIDDIVRGACQTQSSEVGCGAGPRGERRDASLNA